MAQPTTKAEFKEWCLRKLGKPVIEINVDDDQVDDRIDEALSYYWDYHFDGTEKTFLKHVLTSTDITNKYITIAENIIGVVNIFDIGDSLSVNNIFNILPNSILNIWLSTVFVDFFRLLQLSFLEVVIHSKEI